MKVISHDESDPTSAQIKQRNCRVKLTDKFIQNSKSPSFIKKHLNSFLVL